MKNLKFQIVVLLGLVLADEISQNKHKERGHESHAFCYRHVRIPNRV